MPPLKPSLLHASIACLIVNPRMLPQVFLDCRYALDSLKELTPAVYLFSFLFARAAGKYIRRVGIPIFGFV